MNDQVDSPPVSPFKEEFERRMKAFADAIRVDVDRVKQIFRNDFGVDGEGEDSIQMLDREDFVTASDIFKHFVDTGVAKIARVRLGIPSLRGKSTEPVPSNGGDSEAKVVQAVEKLAAANRPITSWSIAELVGGYSEDRPEVAERLKVLTHGRNCIAFNADDTVNYEATLEQVQAAIKQPTSDYALVGGSPVRLFPAGVFQYAPLEESPFYPGVALVNGFCSKSGTDWRNIGHNERVFVRIYAHEIETVPLNKMDMRQLAEEAGRGFSHLQRIYPEAALKYAEFESLGNLPTLKIRHDDVKSRSVDTRKDTGFAD